MDVKHAIVGSAPREPPIDSAKSELLNLTGSMLQSASLNTRFEGGGPALTIEQCTSNSSEAHWEFAGFTASQFRHEFVKVSAPGFR